MNDCTADDPSEGNAIATDEYRPLSGTAVAAAVFGVLSLAAAMQPTFVIVPVLGVALAVVALRQLSQPDAIQVGRSTAVAGLALSMFCGCMGISSSLTKTWNMNRRAELVAARWADAILEGRILEANAMLMPFSRVNAPADEESAASNELFDSAAIEAAYRRRLEVAAMLACSGAKRTAAKLVEYVSESKEREEVWLVKVTIGPCGPLESLDFDVEVESALLPENGGWWERWYVKKVSVRTPSS